MVLLVAFCVFPAALRAAADEGDPARFVLRGHVLDPTRAPVAAASVTSVLDSGTPGPSTTTDARGEFTLTLDPGHYTITVAAEGFTAASLPVEGRARRQRVTRRPARGIGRPRVGHGRRPPAATAPRSSPAAPRLPRLCAMCRSR